MNEFNRQRINSNYKNYYEIIGGPIGKGAFGLVYKGRSKETNEIIAIKEINLDELRTSILNQYDTEKVENEINKCIKELIQEFQIMKICSSKNVNSVKCYEYFNDGKFFVIIMELCDKNLSELLLDKYKYFKTGFNVDEIYSIMIQLNKAFIEMKNNNIIHRDLKLENILIKYDKEKNKNIIKLTDYGSGKILNTINSMNFFDSYKGTILYMAPEILEQKKHNYKCDLWSIGIILYKLRFFKSPYLGERPNALINYIKSYGTKNLKKDENNENFNNLIKKLLQRNIEKRINWDSFFTDPFFFNQKYNNLNYITKNCLFLGVPLSQITGFLYLFVIKFISDGINDLNRIKNNDIRNIISHLKNNSINNNDISVIKLKCNILTFSKYISSVIKETDINDLINLLDINQKKQFFELYMAKFIYLNKLFEKQLLLEQENSYFDYSPIEVSINIKQDITKFSNELNICNNSVVKNLFHGTKKDFILKILKEGFLYSTRCYFGMGVYFTNMLDYVLFYSYENSKRENWGKIIPVGKTFSCISNIIFYNNNKMKKIYDGKYKQEEMEGHLTYEEIKLKYPDKMIEKNGIHLSQIELKEGRLLDEDEIRENKKLDIILGTDYAITEMSQILPLYGLTFKRNEFLVIWKDYKFENIKYVGHNINLEKMKYFINLRMNINIYFKNSIEKAIELIKKKKFNKIILISDINQDLREIEYIKNVRKLLGFPIMILFFSNNNDYIVHIQNLSNVLFCNNFEFCFKYIINYNKEGLNSLKKQVEQTYNTKLKFTQDFFSFSNFIHEGNYDKIYNNKLTQNRLYLKKKDEPKVRNNNIQAQAILYKNK